MTLRMVAGRLRRMKGEPVYGDAIEFLPSEKRAYRSEHGRALVETGLLEMDEMLMFVCPMCGNSVWQHQRFAPACTGPLDEHELAPMILVEGDQRMKLI